MEKPGWCLSGQVLLLGCCCCCSCVLSCVKVLQQQRFLPPTLEPCLDSAALNLAESAPGARVTDRQGKAPCSCSSNCSRQNSWCGRHTTPHHANPLVYRLHHRHPDD